MLKGILRKSWFVAVVALVLAVPTAAPASAEPAIAGGVVAGVVTSTGVPLDPGVCDIATYTFDSTTINGVFAIGNVHNELVVAGSVEVTASGSTTGPNLDCQNGTTGESGLVGAGGVTLDTCEGDATVVVDLTMMNLPGATVDVKCDLAGEYVRVGPVVIVTLSGSVTVDGRTANGAIVVVAALFVPTATGCNEPIEYPDPPGNPGPPAPQDRPTCATQATFAGIFGLVAADI